MNVFIKPGSFQTAAWMVVAAAFALHAAPVEVGDTGREVQDAIGKPQGKALAGDVHVWMYPKGEVEFRDDEVIRVNLMTDAEYRAHQSGLRMQALQRKRAEEATARAKLREAELRRKEILADPEFAMMTPAEQVEVWDEYYTAFPQVERSEKHTAAAAAMEDDADHDEPAPASETVQAEKPQPRLSGSKKRKARRAAGQVKPEDRPAFMTRQTLNIKAKEDLPSYLSGQKVRVPEKQEIPSYLTGQSVNIKSSSENPSFLTDQDAY